MSRFLRVAFLFACLVFASPATIVAQGIYDPAIGGGIPGQTGIPGQAGIPGAAGAAVGVGTPLFPGGTTGGPAGATINNRPRFGTGTGPAGAGRLGLPGGPDSLEQQLILQNQRQLTEGKEPRNEFQDFVLTAIGRELPIFGHDLFRNVPSTFAPVDNVPVTPDYVIGPNDEILIRAWGQIDVDFSAIVDRNGLINVPNVGALNVAGIKYENLTPFLKAAFGRVFRNFELAATMGRLRAMQVFVVGQARRPGSYTVSSLSTLVNTVFAAGGPSSKGSMRSIQLKRGNRIVTVLDLYDLLISGDKSKDAHLQPGDVIYFPPVGPLVAVTGSINVPAIYELRERAPLADVISWAGGLATTAQGQRVTVERIEGRLSRKVEEFKLDSSGLSRPIRDGDLVTVFALVPRFDDTITLRGNVAQPGRFPWREGLRVRDVLPDKEAVVSRDYWLKRNEIVGLDRNVARLLGQQELTGTQLGIRDLAERKIKEDDDLTIGDTVRRRRIELEAARLVDPDERFFEQRRREAELITRSTNPGQLQPQVQANQKPVQPPVQPQRPRAVQRNSGDPTRLVNQIRPPIKEVNWDYAVIERINPQDMTTNLVPFNLGKAILENDPQHNVLLRPGDVLTVFSKEDIQVSAARQTKFIRVEGEFNSPGVYQIQPGETLRQFVARIGGFARSAYVFGAEFTRESTRAQQEKNLDEALNRLERDIERFNITRSQSVSTAEDTGTLKQQAESQTQLVNRLREIRPTGRIVLELAAGAGVADLPDLPLEDGDRLFVPSVPSMVNVFGAVYGENSFMYRPEKRPVDYLAQAGGPTKSADKDSIYVLRADGSVVSRRQSSSLFGSSDLDSLRIMPGDSIVVPEELDRTSLTRQFKDISQIFYQFGLGAAAIRVLKN